MARPLTWLSSRYVGRPHRVASAILKTLFLCHIFTEFGYTMVPVKGASMLPTFEVLGDGLLISKAYRRGRNIKVGDVVQFDAVHEPGAGVIKRVLGMEGDYVMRNSPGARFDDMIQVPPGHCWVVGDNMPYSRDSRHFGPLPMALIKGKVIAKTHPWNERRWITNDLKPVEFNVL